MKTSVEIANNLERRHPTVLRTIRTYIKELEARDLKVENYFKEGEYRNKKGLKFPMYTVTKKGEEIIMLLSGGKTAWDYLIKKGEDYDRF